MPFERYRSNRPDWHSHIGGRYVLVRPDRHAAWRGDESPLDVGAVLDKAPGKRCEVDNHALSSVICLGVPSYVSPHHDDRDDVVHGVRVPPAVRGALLG